MVIFVILFKINNRDFKGEKEVDQEHHHTGVELSKIEFASALVVHNLLQGKMARLNRILMGSVVETVIETIQIVEMKKIFEKLKVIVIDQKKEKIEMIQDADQDQGTELMKIIDEKKEKEALKKIINQITTKLEEHQGKIIVIQLETNDQDQEALKNTRERMKIMKKKHQPYNHQLYK